MSFSNDSASQSTEQKWTDGEGHIHTEADLHISDHKLMGEKTSEEEDSAKNVANRLQQDENNWTAHSVGRRPSPWGSGNVTKINHMQSWKVSLNHIPKTEIVTNMIWLEWN